MEKSVFKIRQMDCSAEERMIRMKLDGLGAIKKLEFDLPGRLLTVFHAGDLEGIRESIDELGLGSSVISSTSIDKDVYQESAIADSDPRLQKKLLWTVLIINLSFFVIEMVAGLISDSMGLVADSLDMLADALVYGMSLLVVGGTVIGKKRVAKFSGYFQITLAVIGFAEIVRRFMGDEALPNFRTMIIVSVLALIANGISLYLLQKGKSKEAHMQASMIFTSNDIIINAGVILAGLLVIFTASAIPDFIIGAIVFAIVIRGAFRILALAK